MTDFTKTFHRESYAAISPTQPHLSQAGRTVLVTGAGGGIGKAIAQAFATASAERVIIAARRVAALEEAKAEIEAASSTTTVQVEKCDISSTEDVDALWRKLAEQKVAVDVVVLNAANLAEHLPSLLPEGANEKLKEIYATNVFGQHLFVQRFLSQGSDTGKVLLNVSSVAAHWNPVVQPAYSTSKMAFTHMLQAIATEVPADKCQMLSFNPGALWTPGAANVGFDKAAIAWDDMSLPSHYAVWAASKDASFLHGRFTWAHWDVDELKAMGSSIGDDSGFLKMGLQGPKPVDAIKVSAHYTLP